MLFNSYEFLLFFLPVTFFGFFALARWHHGVAAAYLTAGSFFFYGWWSPRFVLLLALSIIFNFGVGALIQRAVVSGQPRAAKVTLALGVAVNLLLLGYYKYANFLVANVNAGFGTDWIIGEIILPLGISFFTFTQIAFLADAAQGKVKEYNLVHYALFVSYFPHLIAGPILHHAEMMPQFARRETYRMSWENLAVGGTIFFIGLFKKTVLADRVAPHARSVFDAAAAGTPLALFDAWTGALAYTVQLYFDFSGYSDMAIGLARIFGVTFPLNFASPYKAGNIIEFWHRWHMTLSRFLRDYLYIPLGGNRKGAPRRYLNLMVTMLLGGLWHGASWTFVLWGGLHGAYLVINHGWHAVRRRFGWAGQSRTGRIAAAALTFLAVVVAWVFFRATSLDGALAVLGGMAGVNGVELPFNWLGKWGHVGDWLSGHGVRFVDTPTFASGPVLNWIAVGLAIAWLLPNTQELMGRFAPALDYRRDPATRPSRLRWEPTPAWTAFGVVVAVLALLYMSTGLSEFIYFQF
ncbi:MAG: MBOAT family O-acyltransferase [Burkholderiales bacterium]